ncbi:aldehyde:ferredoxin oxidoreductase [Pelomyxa schiedti]|nr:aldehyde:ferredoxin oxidoreductase [Pelomyxa schiedti]
MASHNDAYVGKILRVDLTAGTLVDEPLLNETKIKWIGGRGLGIKIVTESVDPRVDPLSPENLLVAATGPLTGVGVSTGARCTFVSKSPLTGTLSSTSMGGMFGITLKKSGYDAIIISGKSASPVLLVIGGGERPSLVSASDIWGQLTSKTFEVLHTRYGAPKATSISCIGPGGEKLSKIACIMSDIKHAAGRGGIGAVMGSKMLKAIVCRGGSVVNASNAEALRETNIEMVKKMHANAVCGLLTQHGTNVLMKGCNDAGILPNLNFQSGHCDPTTCEPTTGEFVSEHYLRHPEGCNNCVIRCGRVVEIEGHVISGPEYETAWAFGANCGIFDFAPISKANQLCNEYGIDTISAGGTISCAMELHAKGIISEPIVFGSSECLVTYIDKMGKMEPGIGADLAEGSLRFATKHGHPEFSMSVKGQELPAYDPRGLQGLGLNYSTSVRGGCHVYGYTTAVEHVGCPVKLDPSAIDSSKVSTVIAFQDLTAFIDSVGMCLFSSFALGAAEYAKLAHVATGGLTPNSDAFAMEVGARVWNAQKKFNLAAGITPADDTLPKRLLVEPLQDLSFKGQTWHKEELLGEYYRQRGWDETGIPTNAKLVALGLA